MPPGHPPVRLRTAPDPRLQRRLLRPAVLGLTLTIAACGQPVAQAPVPAPAVIRTTAPPWDVPTDTISYITAAGMTPEPVDLRDNQHVITLAISIDGDPVSIPARLGIDTARAVQAPVHTHDASGQVWLEGRDTRTVTLGQFFTVWGVRLSRTCLGAACGTVLVTTEPALDVSDPTSLKLATVDSVAVTVVSKASR